MRRNRKNDWLPIRKRKSPSLGILPVGTIIETLGCPAMGGFAAVPPERLTIGKWTAISGPHMEGWHVVKLPDGGALLMHESNFKVIRRPA